MRHVTHEPTRSRRSGGAALLIVAGLAFWAAWIYLVWYPGSAPMEEPVNPGQTPNPAKTPWYHDSREERDYRWDRVKAGLVLHGFPALGLVLLGGGLWAIRRRRGPR